MPGSVPMQVHDLPEDPNHAFGEVRDARMRAFLVAYADLGVKTKACDAAGIDRSLIYTKRWRDDPAFQEACARAYVMAAEELEAEARARAIEGKKQYQFDRNGNPLRHPEQCECGHGLALHPRPSDPQEGTKRACMHPDCVEHPPGCSDFLGVPYYEHAVSDTLLKFLLTGAYPDRHRTSRVEYRGLLAKLDMTRLPDHLVDRIASGDNPLEVLATAAEEARTTPAKLMGLSEEEARQLSAGDDEVDEADGPVDL